MLLMRAAGAKSPWTREVIRFRKDLAILTAGSTAFLWLDNLSEHYRGGFQRRLMYVPIIANPVVVAVATAAAATSGARSQRLLALVSSAQSVIAVVGFVQHQRGILRRPGTTPRDYLFNAWYGPPIAAPLQYLGLSLMGLMAGLPRSLAEPVLNKIPANRLMRIFVALNIPPLWGEIVYLHSRGAFQNRAQWIPVVSLPIIGAASTLASFSNGARAARAAAVASASIAILGSAGTAFHFYGLHRRYGGYDRRSFLFNWLNGPPAPAPLQMVGLGLAGLAAERAGSAK